MEYFKFSYTGLHEGGHGQCDCRIQCKGTTALTEGIAYTSIKSLREGAWPEIIAYVTANFDVNGDVLVRVAGDPYYAGIIAGMRPKSNMVLVPAPWSGFPISQSGEFFEPPINVVADLRKAEYETYLTYVDSVTVPEYVKAVESESPHKDPSIWSLRLLAMRAASQYRRVYKLKNGRPPVLLANAMLDGAKMTRALLKTNKDVHVLPESARSVMTLLPAAMPHLYRMLGTTDKFGTENCVLTLEDLNGMYLGSAGGTLEPFSSTYETPSGVKVYQSSNGKKVTTVEAGIERVLNYLNTGEEWQVITTDNPKNEHYFSFEWQESPQGDDAWNKWLEKVRLYMIPDVSFIIVERLVSLVRMLHERGAVIQIGMRWSRGGMDRIAKCLGVDQWNEWVKMLHDGDISGLDSSVHAVFLNLYYSSSTVYEKKNGDWKAKRMLLEFCIKNVITRLTRLIADIYALVTGGMPSGGLNTSHGNSWIMLLWFCLFAVLQIISQPTPQKMIESESYFEKLVKFIDYGDDFVINTPPDYFAPLFDVHAFKLFLETKLHVTMRDERSSLTFLSKEHNGFLIHKGIVFLKYNAILNPDKSEGQSRYVPYRETHDYLVRVLYGRDGRQRDDLDVALSLIGHAYGTYGSNEHAYRYLRAWFTNIVARMGEWKIPFERLSEQSLRKFRQSGIGRDELERGFPSRAELAAKNVWDPVYHENSVTQVRSCLDAEGNLR